MTDWNGFDKGVIGRKLPSDKTLNNMRKADLIELLHIAEDNHNVLAFAYKNAVDNSKCNKCPIPKMSSEHDQQIRTEVIENFLKEDVDCRAGHKECLYLNSPVTCVECIAEQLKEQNK